MASTNFNYLGACGLKVSNICLGTMTFGSHAGGRPSCDEATSHAILDRFVALGGNFIDTADVYQKGESEEIIGNWLQKQDRTKLVIATKCSRSMDPSDPNSVGASRHHIMASVENSLKRLKTTYIDLLYIHLWDYGTPIEETLSALNDLVRSGKVRYIGMSNLKGWQLQKAVELSRSKGFQPIICLQEQYSLLCRTTELEVTEVCEFENVALLPWSPLKGGWLSGRVSKEQQDLSGTRMEWVGSKPGRAMHSHPGLDWFKDDQRVWSVLQKCQEIAANKGKSVPQIAIRWLLQRRSVPSVVIGVRTVEQLEDNMKAGAGWELSKQEMHELDEISEPSAPYPYDYIMLYNKGRFRDSDQ